MRRDTPARVTDDQIIQYGIDRAKVTYDPADNIYYIFDLTYQVTQTVLFDMPMTGSSGKWKYGFLGIGIMAVVAAGFFANEYVRRKRKAL